MRTDYHAFVDGDAGRCGAILRHRGSRSLRTRTVFTVGDDAPVYLVDHVVDHDGDVRRWGRFTYDAPSSGCRRAGTRDSGGSVHVDGTPAPHLAGAVGAYGEHLVLAQMLDDELETVSYVQFDESEPGAPTQEAELHRRGVEEAELLGGAMVEAERIELVVAGRHTNTHWCVGGRVVKSDWCGAQSFLVDDLDALCEGLDREVAARIREFVSSRSGGAAAGAS